MVLLKHGDQESLLEGPLSKEVDVSFVRPTIDTGDDGVKREWLRACLVWGMLGTQYDS